MGLGRCCRVLIAPWQAAFVMGCDDLGTLAQYGGLVRKRVMGRNVVVVTDLDLIREVLRDKEHFLNRSPTGIGEIIPLGLLGETRSSVLACRRASAARRRRPPGWTRTDGNVVTGRRSAEPAALDTNEMWAFHRRTMSPMFADRYMRAYGETFARLSNLLVESWDKSAASGRSFDVNQDLIKLSLDALGGCAGAPGNRTPGTHTQTPPPRPDPPADQAHKAGRASSASSSRSPTLQGCAGSEPTFKP